jgi:hypothetical protein
MRIIRPFEITEDMVTSTNVVLVHPAWSAATDYVAQDLALGIEASLVSHTDNIVYQAVQASGPGVLTPPSDPPLDPPPPEYIGPMEPNTDTNADGIIDTYYWIEYSATNPWQPFYGSVGNYALAGPTMQYVIKPGQAVSGFALFNVSGYSVTVTVEASVGDVRYTSNSGMIDTSEIFDWDTYFFKALESASDKVNFELPASGADPIITIDVEGDTETRLGEIVIGETIDIGYTQRNPSIGIIDYSTKTTDTFGNVTVVPRAFSQKASLRVLVLTDNINYISRVLTLIRSKPVVWGVLEDVNFVSTVLIYGYLKDYNMAVPNPLWSSLNLQIEGLT